MFGIHCPPADLERFIRHIAAEAGQGVDAISLEDALAAHAAHRPVYWSTRSYHDAQATEFLDLANRLRLVPALAEMVRRHPGHPEATPERMLAKLIPVTNRAVREHAEACAAVARSAHRRAA